MKKTLSLRFPAEDNRNMEKGLLDWSINYRVAVCRQSEVYRLIFRKFSGMKFFHRSVRVGLVPISDIMIIIIIIIINIIRHNHKVVMI